MENNLSLKLFYENIMKDYKTIIQIFSSEETRKQIEEIKDFCKFFLNFLSAYSTDDKNKTFILNLIKNYIDDISQYLKNEEIVNTANKVEVEEHDIYKAYGLLWGLEYIFSNSEEKTISEFNYKKYKNFENFLEKYGSYSLLTKNYKKNYREEIQNKVLNITFIKNWLNKLNEKGLKSMKENSIVNRKTKKKKKREDAKEIKALNNKENNTIENSSEIEEEQKQSQYNIQEEIDKKISTDIEKSNIIKEKENNNKIIIKENMESQDKDNIKKIEISKEQINITAPKSKTIIEINDEEGKINKNAKDKDNNSEENIKIEKLSSITNNLKNNEIENINEEFIDISSSIKNNINSPTEINNDLSNKNNHNSQIEINLNLADKNNSSFQTETKIGYPNKNISNYSENKNNDLSNNNKSSSQSQINNDFINKSLSNEELTRIVLSLRKELTDTKEQTEKLRKELTDTKEQTEELRKELKEKEEGLNKKIDRLEKNQLLMYHQMQMYQSSRDIEKSINFFYYDYLFHDEKLVVTNEFEKLQNIIKYLNNENYSLLDKELKTKLRKYFRFHFFANRVSNKILHRNFNIDSKKRLKEKGKDNDLVGLIPGFDYDECFDSLAYFIENNAKNPQLNEAMQIVYKQDYIMDEGLKEIKDNDKEVIRENENGIEILMSKNDIVEIRDYFKTVTIKEETDSFDVLCNKKTWDRGSNVLI